MAPGRGRFGAGSFCLWLFDYSLSIEGNFIAATNDTVHERVFPIATRRCIKRRAIGYTSDGVAFHCVEICSNARREDSDLHGLVCRAMEQFVDVDETRRHALRVMVTQKRLEHMTIGIEAVRPEIRAHLPSHLGQPFLDEGQSHLGCRRVGELHHGCGFGPGESFWNRGRQQGCRSASSRF